MKLDERRAQFKELIDKGLNSPYRIAEITGMKVSTVRTYLSKMGLTDGRPAHNYKKMERRNPARTEAIEAEIRTGKSLSKIGAIFGISRQAVWDVKRKMEE